MIKKTSILILFLFSFYMNTDSFAYTDSDTLTLSFSKRLMDISKRLLIEDFNTEGDIAYINKFYNQVEKKFNKELKIKIKKEKFSEIIYQNMKIRVIYKRGRPYLAGNSLDTSHYQSAKEYMKGVYEILKLELGKKYHSKRQVNVSDILLPDANAMAPLKFVQR